MLSSRNVIDVSKATWGPERRIMLGERDSETDRERERERNQGRKAQNTLHMEVSGRREGGFFSPLTTSPFFQQTKGHLEKNEERMREG